MNKTYYTIEPQNQIQGLNYSSWQPTAITNQKILVDTGIQSNWKYRQYMQKNASHIMKYNTMENIYESGNNPYPTLNTQPTNKQPYLLNGIHDNNKPQGLNIVNSDLKQNYLTKEQMKARMISPSIPVNF
jgi:hypothetical protein